MKKILFILSVVFFLNSCTIVNSPTLLFKTPSYKVDIPKLGFSKSITEREEAFYETDVELDVFFNDSTKFNIFLKKDSTVFFTVQDGVIMKQTVSRF